MPCLLYEDDDLLVVNKPVGMNTHAPGPYAGEGIYDWLRHRERRWEKLAIIHRLDKETSGVMVYAKSRAANRALTGQFTRHSVGKKYLLMTDRPVRQAEFQVVSALVRAGTRYLSRPLHAGAERAETRFRVLETRHGRSLVEAVPVTGRTHQIRVHAAASGLPVLGDVLYGGTPGSRVCLHAQSLTLRHPTTGQEMTFEAPVEFAVDARLILRRAFIDGEETDAFRLVHGAADGWPGWYVDRLGEYLLSLAERPLGTEQTAELSRLMHEWHSVGAYQKTLTRQVRQATPDDLSPRPLIGEAAPEEFIILENGLQYRVSFQEGYSTGLFLDQRDNRRRFVSNWIAAQFPIVAEGLGGKEVLNAFAYTCGFSVCAAKAGARVTSLDLSRKYLDWGRRNFTLNGLDPAAHDFIYGDVFDWLRRLAKKGRRFDALVLDPPTFSQSKQHGVFRAEKDYGELVALALPLLKPDGVLLASTNAATLKSESFLEMVFAAINSANRPVRQQHYVPQPPDFPVTREEPAYLKTVWLRIG